VFYFGLLTVLIWVYLVVAHGRFWVIEAEDRTGASGGTPSVAVIIPARDEAAVIGEAVTSVARQVNSGPLHVFVVDDHSSDGTGDAARRAAAADLLTVVPAGELPAGWAGKVWAMAEGVQRAREMFRPEFYLFTDADIVHAPDNLAGLLSRAAEGWDMVSLMVHLRCHSLAERALVPAFVYFFFKLYPPAWICASGKRTAGAAGGCMLVRASALETAGGLAAIAGERIDDCALAARIKRAGGRVWLGAAARTRSVREYPHFGDILRMISRSAYTQLRYSPTLLAGTVTGMAVVYFAPLLLLFTGAWALGIVAWALMAMTFVPVLRLYGRSLAWAPLLPGMAGFYVAATVHSAWMHWRGRGGVWKGRLDLTE
jgi:hopene-associated glycosyltransferase HpnB